MAKNIKLKYDSDSIGAVMLQGALISSAVLLVLIGIIRCFNAPVIKHQLESADAEFNYGTGIAAFFRRLFKHPIASGLTDNQKTKIAVQESLKFNDAYFKTLESNGTMLANAKLLVKEMIAQGITSPFSQAGLLAVVSKESNFVYKRENLDYTAAQLQKVFGMDAATAAALAHKPQEIANKVYGGKGGNTGSNDGWLYRGGGPNQVTFKNGYEQLGKEIGIDLVTYPDKIDEPEIAAKAGVKFFMDGFASLKKSTITLRDGTKVNHMKFYNNPTGSINGFANETDAAAAFYNINAGAGQTEKFLLADVTGGRALCMARATGFLDFIKKQTPIT